MKDFLTAQEVLILQEAHHSSRLRKSADRIKTILALNQGLTYQETAKLLLLAPKYGLKCLEAQRSG